MYLIRGDLAAVHILNLVENDDYTPKISPVQRICTQLLRMNVISVSYL